MAQPATVRVYRFDTLEPIGVLSLDPVSGALASQSGPPEFSIWVDETLSAGLRERRSVVQNGNVDVFYETVLPSDPAFSRFLNLRLLTKNWCDETVRDAVVKHPNFARHPWRLAHRPSSAPNRLSEGPA